jgi:hypothetical protein
VVGLFFNRPTSQNAAFNEYIRQRGSDLFRALDPVPWFDLAYGFAPKHSLALGLSTSLTYDRSTVADRRASAASANLLGGLRLGSKSGPSLDLGLGLMLRRLEDQSLEGITRSQTDGTGLSLELRYRWPLGPKLILLPFLGLERDNFALAPEHREHMALQLGVGIHLVPAQGALVVMGLNTRYQKTEQRVVPQPVESESALLLPALILGGEVQVGSMLFRLGIRHESWLIKQMRLRSNQMVESSSFATNFTTRLGLGFEFGALTLDGLLERDFLRDGPHFLGGSRHGGGVLSHLGLTYRFAPPSQ